MSGKRWTCDSDRLNTFSDGVIVVSMTLLVLDLRLPDNLGPIDGPQMWHALAELWPKYIGYVVSFLVIAQYWMGYTKTFGRMREADTGFIRLNILFLMFVGVIPFATALMSENRGQVATSLYAGAMIALALILTAMWLYAIRNGLLESEFAPRQRWRGAVAWIQIAVVFGASIGVAQFNPQMAKLVWLLLAVPTFQDSAEPADPAPASDT